jgi:hypothetical protein
MKHKFLLFLRVATALLPLQAAAGAGDNFPVVLYTPNNPPATPALTDLPLMTSITNWGVTWTFLLPTPVGRFVNGDYYVVGPTTIIDISPPATNGANGAMLNIQVNIQKSGFDSRIASGRYNAALRVTPPIVLTPGNKLVSSISSPSNYLNCVMRPVDVSESPVSSVSILTCVPAPLPPDAFRPSYAKNSTNIYLSRNLRRQLLPTLAPVQNVPPLSEFEGYLQRPWVDSVFFNFDVPSSYMVSYGREGGYLIGFAGLLLTLNFTPAQKEPLLVYMVQYGIDLYGLVQQGHAGWPGWGGYGQGRKLPILLAGLMLNQPGMTNVQAQFGEDMQTIWITETLPAGTYKQSWHKAPQTAVYGGHTGINGESMNLGWGPYEHLPPSAWVNLIGEEYVRCCTSFSWIGEALAARLIPGMQSAWNHPQFFAYADRWMFIPDDPADLARIQNEAGFSIGSDVQHGQTWKVLNGGGYNHPYANFGDHMWAAYRNMPLISGVQRLPDSSITFTVSNLNPNKTNYVQVRTNASSGSWTTVFTNVSGAWSSLQTNVIGSNVIVTNITGTNSFVFRSAPTTNRQNFYRVMQHF